MSDTPRTDAAHQEYLRGIVQGKLASSVHTDFARQLERELAALQERYDRLAKDYSDLVPGQGEMVELEQLRKVFENAPTGTEARVCADIAARQQAGIAKYGTTVEENPIPLAAWLQHAYEEGLDKAIYLKRSLEELAK